ncbi:Uncharacterised protein [Yersinia enterocolitica]|nr:Uncharacterised protein [Yersinia enterocolitica]
MPVTQFMRACPQLVRLIEVKKKHLALSKVLLIKTAGPLLSVIIIRPAFIVICSRNGALACL